MHCISMHTDKNLLQLLNFFSYGQRLYEKYEILIDDSTDSVRDKIINHFYSSMSNLL